uniref:Uncharacterized protein n=1 Tax=Denticeps clupeoides TaxID=299321 RepID=A0AAY4CXV2_9TELE
TDIMLVALGSGGSSSLADLPLIFRTNFFQDGATSVMLRRSRVFLRQVVNLMARRPDLFCGAIVLSCLLVLAVKLACR